MTHRSLCLLALLTMSCMPANIQGGSNANDRSNGGTQGETLLTGAMIVSPDGKYIVAQRNQTSVLVNVGNRTAHELPTQIDRFVFAKAGERGFAVLSDHVTVVAYDLKTEAELWRSQPSFEAATGVTLEKLSDDDGILILGDQDRLLLLNAQSGKAAGSVTVGSVPTELSLVPGTKDALVLGSTRWSDHKPQTDFVEVNLETQVSNTIVIPNCSAPIVVNPGATRAFVSPTFCEEGTSSNASQWTNPDPVSVVDLLPDSPTFVKNLPGFGPVAMDSQGQRVVAYLDIERMDASMFDDKAKVPSLTGPRYHILTIDPVTLTYDLAPVGDVLPRFVLAKDGHTLIVDATVQLIRGEAKVQATIDTNGNFTADIKLFGSISSLLGQFDTLTQQYQSLSGAAASLDRFVQLGDAINVYTLKMTADGLGGDLYHIDLSAKAATSLGLSLRDIGLLADAKTLVLRERLPAVQVKTGSNSDWYRRERFCFSLDGVNCQWSVDFQDSVPFQSGPTCTSYHDC
jgi:hypothetical protein